RYTLRRIEVRQVTNRRGVLVVVGRIRVVNFLLRLQVTQVAHHGLEVGLLTSLAELRNRDSGQNADDHDNDQQLDECETVALLEHTLLLTNLWVAWNDPSRDRAPPDRS